MYVTDSQRGYSWHIPGIHRFACRHGRFATSKGRPSELPKKNVQGGHFTLTHIASLLFVPFVIPPRNTPLGDLRSHCTNSLKPDAAGEGGCPPSPSEPASDAIRADIFQHALNVAED